MCTRRSHRRSDRRSPAFTLVELLVVIGIIAVLISVLLPALARARQAGNLVDCQARLRQMGQALQIYTVANKDYLPWGAIDHSASWTDSALPNASNQQSFWWWYFTLSEVMNKNLLGRDALVRNLNPVFRDKDTIENPQEPAYVNHYVANARILYPATYLDNYPAQYGAGGPILAPDRRPRKASTIKPSGVFVIWDGPQVQDDQFNTYGLSQAMDGFALDNGHCFVLGWKGSGSNYDRPVTPGWVGSLNNPNGKSLQKQYNVDVKMSITLPFGWLSHLRFRHMKNTTMAALSLDGHVETRTVGTAMVKDFCTNPF